MGISKDQQILIPCTQGMISYGCLPYITRQNPHPHNDFFFLWWFVFMASCAGSTTLSLADRTCCAAIKHAGSLLLRLKAFNVLHEEEDPQRWPHAFGGSSMLELHFSSPKEAALYTISWIIELQNKIVSVASSSVTLRLKGNSIFFEIFSASEIRYQISIRAICILCWSRLNAIRN